MKRPKLSLVCIVAILLALLLVTPSRADVLKIRLGTHVSLYYYTFFMERPDLLKHYGKTYQIEWYVFSGGGEAMPALAANKVDGTFLSPFPFANAITKAKLDLTGVHQVVSMGEEGYYSDTWIARSDSGINGPKDLKGKIIGVNAIGSTSEMGVRILMKKQGYEAGKDYTIVEGKPPYLSSMVLDKKIDCAVVFQPFYSSAHMKGGIKDIANDVDIYGSSEDYLFVVFRTDFLKKNAQAIRDYLDDYLQIMKWARSNRSEAARIYAKKWKMDEALVQIFLPDKESSIPGRTGGSSPQRIQIVVDTLYENGFLKEKFDVAPHIDNSYLPKWTD